MLKNGQRTSKSVPSPIMLNRVNIADLFGLAIVVENNEKDDI